MALNESQEGRETILSPRAMSGLALGRLWELMQQTNPFQGVGEAQLPREPRCRDRRKADRRSNGPRKQGLWRVFRESQTAGAGTGIWAFTEQVENWQLS